MAKPIRITESLAGTRSVDVEKGVIPGVKFIGLKSKKGHDYSADGLKQAVSLYEGIQIFSDHPDPNNPKRKIRELIAVGVKPEFQEGRGIVGTLKVFKERESGRVLLEAAQDEDKAKAMGLSHNADPTKISYRNGKKLVEGIEKVYSVDLVHDPATTNGLYESCDIAVGDLLASISPRIGKLFEQYGMPMRSMMAMPEEETPFQEQAKEALKTLVLAVFDDETITDMDEKKKLIDKIFEQQKALLGGEDSPIEPLAKEPPMADDTEKKDDEETKDEDKKEEKKDDEKKEESSGKVRFGQILEWSGKYKVSDKAILEAACELPPDKAERLLENEGRKNLAKHEEATSSGNQPEKKGTLIEGRDDWIKRIKERRSGYAELLESIN